MGPDKQAGMAVGDVNSKEMGTGARANGDKPKWDLMPLDQIAKLVDQEPGLGRWLKVYTDPDLSDSHKPYMADKWHHSINAQMFRVLGLFQSGRIEAFELLQAATIYNWYYVKRIGNDQATMMDSLEPVIRVWEYGLIKYAEFNWRKVCRGLFLLGAFQDISSTMLRVIQSIMNLDNYIRLMLSVMP